MIECMNQDVSTGQSGKPAMVSKWSKTEYLKIREWFYK